MLENFEDKQPFLAEQVFIASTAIVIGDVIIGNDSSVWPMTVIRGDVNYIRIGERTNIQDSSVLHVTHAGRFNTEGHPLLIGNDVTIGHKAVLHGCKVEDFCLIGIASTIMDGVHIAPYTIVGAGSLVPPNKILDGGLWLGSPARKIRALTEEEMEFLRYSAAHYVLLKDRYLSK